MTFVYFSCNRPLCSRCRTRILLLNTFDLAEDKITMDTVFEWIERLNATYPQQFAEISSKLETCDLEKELDTVCTSSLEI